MKKFDGKHRKRIGRKKRELIAWRSRRAMRKGGSVRKMLQRVALNGDPLAHAPKKS